MSAKPTRYGRAPAERRPGVPPAEHVSRAPRRRRAGVVPNPRKPKLVRDVNGGALLDLFALFPDLPRPPRPAGRVPPRIARRRPTH